MKKTPENVPALNKEKDNEIAQQLEEYENAQLSRVLPRIKKIKITAPNPQNMTSRNARLIGFRFLRLALLLAIAYLY